MRDVIAKRLAIRDRPAIFDLFAFAAATTVVLWLASRVMNLVDSSPPPWFVGASILSAIWSICRFSTRPSLHADVGRYDGVGWWRVMFGMALVFGFWGIFVLLRQLPRLEQADMLQVTTGLIMLAYAGLSIVIGPRLPAVRPSLF